MPNLDLLPPWLLAGLNHTNEDAAALVGMSKATTFRSKLTTLTAAQLTTLLAWEFTKRKRPRRWVVTALMARLNTLRNEEYAASVAHLQTWVFRAGE